MLRVGLLCFAAVLVSCNEPSRLDNVSPKSGEAPEDPWAANPAKPRRDDDKPARKDRWFGGGDMQGMLAKVADGVSKPGPYEAPEHSKDLDDTRPHWGVLSNSGDIVERASLSWTGSHGTELRALIERLRELAADDKLAGVLVRAGSIEISVT